MDLLLAGREALVVTRLLARVVTFAVADEVAAEAGDHEHGDGDRGVDAFVLGATVVHLDADPREISKIRHADVAIVGSLRATLGALASAAPAPQGDERLTQVAAWKPPTRSISRRRCVAGAEVCSGCWSCSAARPTRAATM